MSSLTSFRDHCREMADPPKPAKSQVGGWCQAFGKRMPVDHDKCTAAWCHCGCHPRNAPPSPEDRALWIRLADEIDAYLSGGGVEEDLFGELTAEPALADRLVETDEEIAHV